MFFKTQENNYERYLLKQCAADITNCSATKEPPQNALGLATNYIIKFCVVLPNSKSKHI